jgi:GNAT superfamily N-acetyltransferase
MLRDGYTDIPAGKIAAIATSLEMLEPPALRPSPSVPGVVIRPVSRPEAGWYCDLFRRIGAPWLWQSRLRLAPAALEAIIRSPDVAIWSVVADGRDEGLLELDFRQPGACELAFFGLTVPLTGRGIGRALMNQALSETWRRPIRRMWLHTCTLDHPGALAFYIRSGFRPFQLQLEIADDPRLDGTLPADAAPSVPIIRG